MEVSVNSIEKKNSVFLSIYLCVNVYIIETYIKYIVLAALIYMPIFGHLDTLPIRIWDEARLAINWRYE
mgnify:CR=1 FL=1